jgi:hypothetical protein
MSFLVPIMMWGWIPISIIFFRIFPIQKAILITVIGGFLFLPVQRFDYLPMIEFNKNIAIALSLLLGIIFSGKKNAANFRLKSIDIPIIVWCVVSPFLSIMANDLGPYNAVAAVIETSLIWGIYYIAGRIYFPDEKAMRLLIKGMIIGGLIYFPLVLFEVRMSPQLSNIVYGFFPHSFIQHIRYGGFRPIVFMDHGLVVALWMAATFVISIWLFGTKEIAKIGKIPMIIVVMLLLISVVLCKSANGWTYSTLGILSFLFYKKRKSKRIFKIIIFIIPIYIIIRISGILSADTILHFLSNIFDAERIDSLSWRLLEEELFGVKALQSPLLGWGWMNRAWPTNMVSGENIIQFIDSLYLIVFSIRGFLGIISLYSVLLLGPWKIMKTRNESVDAVILSIILIFYIIDSLLNGSVVPIYILIAGVLISVSEKTKNSENFDLEILQSQ